MARVSSPTHFGQEDTMRPTRPLATTLVGALVGLAALTGCGSSSGPTSGSGATSTPVTSWPPASTASATPSRTAAADPAPTSTKPVQAGHMATPASLLTSIRVAHHPTYDRVVFQFAGPLPGYRVAYVPRIVMDASGDPVAVKGAAFLQVIFQGGTLDTTMQMGSAGGRYSGPRRITPSLPAVREIAFAGDFEAVLSWGVGVSAKTGFRVLPLKSPSRLAVDVAVP
jgi:hypothetical protein